MNILSEDLEDFLDTPEHWQKLTELFAKEGNIVFPYCGDNYTQYFVSLNQSFRPFGRFYPGWEIERKTLVSILYKGAFHFDLSQYQHPDYVADKLNLSSSDGAMVAKLLNEIGSRLFKNKVGRH